jgi:hypothetical protein
VERVDAGQITFDDLLAGRLPADLTGVRWPDGTIECRFNVTADDYASRVRSAGAPPSQPGTVLVDASVSCDRCADKCG